MSTSTPTLIPFPHPYVEPFVIANYFPWYDMADWSSGCTSDTPLEPYNSDEPKVIARHIAQARSAGPEGFAVHWLGSGDRTDANFGKVLSLSPDGFYSTATFLAHILPGRNQSGVIDALRYIMASYTQNLNFLRVRGKPVIMFSDMYRVPDEAGRRPTNDGEAVAVWSAIRGQVDPDHNAIWMAEGLVPDYMAVFDGLYVYKIDHACWPEDYLKAPRWAGWVRGWEAKTGMVKYWAGTIQPGWNDLHSAKCEDMRVFSQPFARDRGNGKYYQRTVDAVLPTRPDFIVVHSFNEWIEGSMIEPSVTHGDLYLKRTARHVTAFKLITK